VPCEVYEVCSYPASRDVAVTNCVIRVSFVFDVVQIKALQIFCH
jgi:hypothetical protein